MRGRERTAANALDLGKRSLIQNLSHKLSPANLGIRSMSEMRVEMVKEKGNCRHTGSTGEHSHPETSSDKFGYLKFLQMLYCSEESQSIILDVEVQITELDFQSCLSLINLEDFQTAKVFRPLSNLSLPLLERVGMDQKLKTNSTQSICLQLLVSLFC